MKNETTIKPWWKSRTIVVAVLMAISGVITTLETEFQLPGIVITLKGLFDMWLRVNTSSKVE